MNNHHQEKDLICLYLDYRETCPRCEQLTEFQEGDPINDTYTCAKCGADVGVSSIIPPVPDVVIPCTPAQSLPIFRFFCDNLKPGIHVTIEGQTAAAFMTHGPEIECQFCGRPLPGWAATAEPGQTPICGDCDPDNPANM